MPKHVNELSRCMLKPGMARSVKLDSTCSNIPDGYIGQPNRWFVMFEDAIKPVFMTDAEYHARICPVTTIEQDVDGELKHVPTRINQEITITSKSGKKKKVMLLDRDICKKMGAEIKSVKKDRYIAESKNEEFEAAINHLATLFSPDDVMEMSPLEMSVRTVKMVQDLQASGIATGAYFNGNEEPDDMEIINNYHIERCNRRQSKHYVEISEAKGNYTKEAIDEARQRFIDNRNNEPEDFEIPTLQLSVY